MAIYDARPSPFTQLTATSEWENFLSACGIWDGIDTGNSFSPSLDNVAKTVNMSAGTCQIKGMLWRSDATLKTNIPAAQSQDRIDRLTIRLGRNALSSSTMIQANIISGSPSGSPTLPPLQQTPTDVWDIPVCHWTTHSNGVVDTLVDERQFSSRPTVIMSSGNHPTPPSPRLGLETDTGNLYRFDGTNWIPLVAASNILGFVNVGALGDVSGWVDQCTINFTLTAARTVNIFSYMTGTQITNGPAADHVNRIEINGGAYEVGRDRNVPKNDPSSISGFYNGILNPGAYTIKSTAYCSPVPQGSAWRLTIARLMVIGY